MRVLRSSLIVAIVALAPAAAAADSVSSQGQKKEQDPEALRPTLGLHAGSGVATHRLGPSLDLSLDFSLQKLFGAVLVSGGLRPHYERFGIGESAIVSCEGIESCGGSAIARSQSSAHVASLEVPFVAELPVTATTFNPFVGVAPSFGYMRSTETRQGLVPNGNTTDVTDSRTYFAFSAFGGGAIKITDRGSFVVRVGYRFAPMFDDLPGGAASLRGVIASIGYRVVL